MRKIIMFNLISVDGFFEGENNDITWHHLDDEFQDFAIEQTGKAGIIMFGRTTYELMAQYWPLEETVRTDPIVANLMNSTPKMVFSKTLQSADWSNTTLKHEVNADEMNKLKAEEGKDIFIFGSSDLTVSMMKLGLVDELRILVNPLILGKGKRLFQGLDQKMNLELLDTRTFKNGNILLTYGVQQ